MAFADFSEQFGKRIKKAVHGFEGGFMTPPKRRRVTKGGSGVRQARVSVESGDFGDGRPYSSYPAELGRYVGVSWQGTDRWITVLNPKISFFFENDVIEVFQDGGDWVTTDAGRTIEYGTNGGSELTPSDPAGPVTINGEELTGSNGTGIYIQPGDPVLAVYRRGVTNWLILPLSC